MKTFKVIQNVQIEVAGFRLVHQSKEGVVCPRLISPFLLFLKILLLLSVIPHECLRRFDEPLLAHFRGF